MPGLVLEMQPRPAHGLTLILGDQGMGKSTLYKLILWENLVTDPRLHRPIYAWDYGSKIRERQGLVSVRGMKPEAFAQWCFRNAPCVAAADESDKLFPSQGPKEGSALDELLCYGRNAQPDPALPWPRFAPVSGIFVCRRPLELAPKLRSSVDCVFTFRLSHEEDRKVLWKDMGAPRELAEETATLPKLEWRSYDRT